MRMLQLGDRRHLVVGSLLVSCLIVGARPAAAGLPVACVGDCHSDGAVGIDELITGVSILLGSQPLSACRAMDDSGDGSVTVNELVRAVTNALNGCPPVTPATPTPSNTETLTPSPEPTATSTPLPPSATPTTAPTLPANFCDLPGSIQHTAAGVSVVPGGPDSAPDLSFLQLPVGFCAHYFATIGNTRQLRFAPGGELFVASPTTFSTGGGIGGLSSIMVVPDDDHDGLGDTPTQFLGTLPSTQGLLFTDGFLYFQDHTQIRRLPYAAGDRTLRGDSELVADINIYFSPLHWPKTLDVADDGTIYVANGGDQSEPCDPSHPFHGGILELDGSPNGALVARGFRNPISVRCPRGHNLCYAIELTRDFTATVGGREKLLPIREGDDWGFPCCATKDVPFPDIHPVPDCSGIASETGSFVVGHTPFDVDYETGKWPEPWNNRAYVVLHGAYQTWEGARVVAIAMDPVTGEVLQGSELDPEMSGALSEFAAGWDDHTLSHGRPANMAFAPDGRLFLGNDSNGVILWIAPLELARPAS